MGKKVAVESAKAISKELILAKHLLEANQKAADMVTQMGSQIRDFLVIEREKAIAEYNRALEAEKATAKNGEAVEKLAAPAV